LKEGSIVVNDLATLPDSQLNDTGILYFDSSKPGYDTIFKKEIMHETGHSLGLGHPDIELVQTSVMNRVYLLFKVWLVSMIAVALSH